MSVSLKFKCALISKDFIEIEATNQRIEIIIVNHDDFGEGDETCGVSLDKFTAIKLSKELRKQIALLD
jgi:hypothetical protein